MSSSPLIDLDGEYPSVEQSGGGTNTIAPQFVNPQYTDRRFGLPQLDVVTSYSCLQNGMLSPRTPGPASRRPSSDVSEAYSFPKSAFSSTSSFVPSPKCLTPSTSRSASSSRRQSAMLPEAQQYYLSTMVASPSFCAERAKTFQKSDTGRLQEHFSPDVNLLFPKMTSLASIIDTSSAPENDFLMAHESFSDRDHADWQRHEATRTPLSTYGRAMHIDQLDGSNLDLQTNYEFPLSQQCLDLCAENMESMYSTDTISPDDILPSQIAVYPRTTVCALAEPLELRTPEGAPPTISSSPFVEYDSYANIEKNIPSNNYVGFRDPTCRKNPGPRRNVRRESSNTSSSNSLSAYSNPSRKRPARLKVAKQRGVAKAARQKDLGRRDIIPGKIPAECVRVSGAKKHLCLQCKVGYNAKGEFMSEKSFDRPEHLKRHQKSCHNPTPIFCYVADCAKEIKYGTGIQSRSDNLKPHYRTHFRYGPIEKSGKNRRISLKESYEENLTQWDERWPYFLDGRLNGDPPEEPDDFHYTWKMLGWSIRETQRIKIKDIVPEWDGPADMTLKDRDPRWKSLLNGTMDFEMAMSIGLNMKETEKQGLLGVDMLESETMGIASLDPRWAKLLDRRMSIEESEKLGVKHRNPVWTDLRGKSKRDGSKL